MFAFKDASSLLFKTKVLLPSVPFTFPGSLLLFIPGATPAVLLPFGSLTFMS
jgi:hypothetical protein